MVLKLTPRRGNRGRRPGPLTTADLVVLSLLAERAMHGYELLGEYERQEVAEWASVSKAQVYYALQKLAELHLIVPDARGPAVSDRDRTVYRPTAAGEDALRRGLSEDSWSRSRLAQPFATWLGLSIHLAPADTQRMIAARRTFVEKELVRERASLAEIAALPSPRARVGEQIVRLVIAHMEAELRWLATLPGGDLKTEAD